MQIAARFVVPRAGDVIAGGHVAWQDGALAHVGSGAPAGGGAVTDLGDVVVLPGLVNAHTHLGLSGLRGQVPADGGFVDWVLRLLAAQKPLAAADFAAATADGVAQCVAAGTVAVGDIVSIDAGLPPLRASGLGGVAYLETLGASLQAADAAAAALPGRLQAAEALAGDLEIGVSPHAPYSTHPTLFARASKIAAARPLAVHISETRDEIDFCRDGSGELVRLLRTLGIAEVQLLPDPVSPIAFLDTLGLLGPDTLCIHANYPVDDDLQRLAAAHAPVAYCPRSHAFFSHPPHPVARMRDAGITVALGTDSLASNDSLSLRDEMAFLAETRSDLSPDAVLDMATRGGALALNTGSGVLEPGAPADCTVVTVPAGGGDAIERVIAGEGEVVATVAAGRVLFDPHGCLAG